MSAFSAWMETTWLSGARLGQWQPQEVDALGATVGDLLVHAT